MSKLKKNIYCRHSYLGFSLKEWKTKHLSKTKCTVEEI
jgi:hypothetical protein